MADLTPKQAQFVREYLIDLNGTQAAIRAGYSPRSAEVEASRLLANAKVAAVLAVRMEERAERTEITADKVLRELWDIATADPNELIQFRRGACRDCWFDGEPEPDVEMEEQAHGGALKRTRSGDGREFDRNREPNPNCPHCSGEGWGRAFVPDTRTLKGSARKLYAGVKVTKEGLEVKMHDKAAALVNVGRHLGMFTDKHELTAAVTILAQPLDDAI